MKKLNRVEIIKRADQKRPLRIYITRRNKSLGLNDSLLRLTQYKDKDNPNKMMAYELNSRGLHIVEYTDWLKYPNTETFNFYSVTKREYDRILKSMKDQGVVNAL